MLKPRAFKKEDKNNNAEALVHVIAVGHNCHSLTAAQIIHIAVVPLIAFLCPQQWESTFIDNNDDHTDDSERFYQVQYDSIAGMVMAINVHVYWLVCLSVFIKYRFKRMKKSRVLGIQSILADV